MHNNCITLRDLTSVGIWIQLYRNEGWPFPIYLVSERNNSVFFFFEHQNRKCSTAAPHDSKPFYYMFCENCSCDVSHISNNTQMSENVFKLTSCFSCTSLTGTSSQTARKEVTNIMWVRLKTQIRPIFIWGNGCKTTKERIHVIPDCILLSCFGGFFD